MKSNSSKNTLSSSEMECKEVTLDLLNRNEAVRIIQSAALKIKGRLFGAPMGIYRLCIEEEVQSIAPGVPNPLIMKPGKTLLELQYNEFCKPSHEIDVNGNTTVSFNILLNPQNIIDCACKEGHRLDCKDNILYDKFSGANMPDVSYKVTYVVSCYDDKNELYVKTEPETLTICFAKQANVRPEFFFIPFEKYDDGVEYDATVKEPIEIGYLHVANSGSLMMSPTINVRFKVTAKDSDGEDLPEVFSLGEHCPTVNPWNYCSELNPDGTSVSHVNSVRLAPNEYKVSCLDSNLDSSRTNVCSQPFPLLFNMAALKNPDSDEKITLSVQYYYEKTGMPVSLSPELNETIRICLRRNQSMMDLEVVVEDFEGETVIAKTERGSALGNIQAYSLVPMLISPTQIYEFTLGLRNSASAGEDGAAIYVKDFSVSSPKGIERIILDDSELDPMRSLFTIEPVFEEAPIYEVGFDETLQIRMRYTPARLASIVGADGKRLYNTVISFPYSFKYAIDAEGKYVKGHELQYIEVVGSIDFKVVKFPSAEWLCIDFGSSAVVASYGAGNSFKGAEVNRLLKLGGEKQILLSGVFKAGESVKRQDDSESSEYLISSVTTLDRADLQSYVNLPNNTGNYGKSAVCFSPSTGMMDFSHIIPCLKSLMGHDELNKSMIADELIRNSAKQILVNDIFRMVYKQLFELFIPGNALQAEKLVMSYPNTYAPKHIGMLRQIAYACMPNLRPDYLRFISESDAVAFYYLDKRTQIINNSNIDAQELVDKHVLVYDMGAGTLDLTYFTNTEKGGRKRISIEGKMGVSKAGNYADYLLAQIVIDMIATRMNQETASKIGIDNVETFKKELTDLMSLERSADRDLDEMYQFKNYIKSHVKPFLNNPVEKLHSGLKLINKSMDVFLEGYTIQDILEHNLFKQFLRDVTTDVFSNFVSLFGEVDAAGNSTLPVDVVVFSGRMTGIKRLRTAVGDALRSILPGGTYERCRFTDLASRKFINLDEEMNDVTALKTVVADGAMAFCTRFAMGNAQYELVNTNMYATYGLIIVPRDGADVWLPLLDSKTRPSKKGSKISEYGMVINEYDTRKHKVEVDSLGDGLLCSDGRLDLSRISELILVQSYSADTQGDWRAKKKEFMTILGSYRVPEDMVYPCAVNLMVDNQNNLNLYVGGAKEDFLSKDDVDNVAFRRSSWPIVF